MVWHVPLAAFPWFQFPHASDVIETRFTLVLAGTIVAALLRFDGHSDLAHLHHRSSHIIISSDIICAYLCISVQSWWPFTAWEPEVGVKYWSPYVFVAGPISWLGLIKAQASSQRMIHNPWGSVGDQWGIPREITSDSKGIPRGFPFLQRFVQRFVQRFAGASSLGVSLHCACSQYLPVMSTLPANLVDQTHQQ